MKQIIAIGILVLFAFQSCTQKQVPKQSQLKFYSVAKWLDFKTLQQENLNFYDFQVYTRNNMDPTESKGLFSYQTVISEKAVFNYLKKKLTWYDTGFINLIPELNINEERDSATMLLDVSKEMHDSYIAIWSLGSVWGFNSTGTMYSGRENYLIKQVGDSITILAALPPGIVKGIYIDPSTGLIRKVLFEEIKRDYSDEKTFGGKVVYTLSIEEGKISFSEIVNVRNGEPFDASDSVRYFDDLEGFTYFHQSRKGH